MSSALNTVMSNIYMSIPKEILEMFFREYSNTGLSIDEHIRNRVIVPVVLPRINSSCGMTKYIELLQGYIEHVENKDHLISLYGQGDLYRIPMAARDNREIIEVRRLTGYPYADQVSSPNTLSSMQNHLLSSYTYGDNVITTGSPVLREGNIIFIRPSIITDGLFVECVLGFDKYFTGLPKHAEIPLANYVTVILKTQIRTKLNLSLEQGELIGGVVVPRVREIIDSYEQDSTPEFQQSVFNTLRGSVSIISKENFGRYLSHYL